LTVWGEPDDIDGTARIWNTRALTRHSEAISEHRDFWLKSWFELEGAASALVAKIDALSEGQCGPFAIKNSIANSPEMDALRAALASEPTNKSHAEIMAEASPADLDVIDGQVSDDAVVERASRIGDVGSPERLLWVAGCAQRDLQAAASHSEAMPDWVRGTMSDGAEAIRQLSEALSTTNGEAVSELVEAARVLAEGEFELATDATAFEAAMDRLAKAVAKLGSRTPGADLASQVSDDAVVERAFDLGCEWTWGLRGQTLEDSRAVGRTLTSDLFEDLAPFMDMEGFNSFESADLGICAAKKIIRDALSRRAALSATNSEAVSELDQLREELRVYMLEQPLSGERNTYSDGFANGLCEAIRRMDKLGSRAPSHNSEAVSELVEACRETDVLLTELLDGPSNGDFWGIGEGKVLRGKLLTVRDSARTAAAKLGSRAP
jgi:hypothetical protein